MAMAPAQAGFEDEWYSHPGLTQNYLFFDSHVERLKLPPHPLDRRVGQIVTLQDGTVIVTEGFDAFKNRFHNGLCPLQ